MPAWNRKPRATKAGKLRYSVGYIDENNSERTKGGFSTQRGAGGTNAWIKKYVAAEAEGRASLGEFLDFEVRGIVPAEGMNLDTLMLAFMSASEPGNEGGLALATYRSYISIYRTHIRPIFGPLPIEEFEKPALAAQLRDSLRSAADRPGSTFGPSTVTRTMRMLSSALSWGVERGYLETNGVRQLTTRKRRSSRRSASATSTRRSTGTRAKKHSPWRALSADAAAAVIFELKFAAATPLKNRTRDAAFAAVLFLTGCRPQDAWGLRWGDVGAEQLDFVEVVSTGELLDGKVAHSERPVSMTAELHRWLMEWRDVAAACNIPTGADAFVFPGAAPEGHMTEHQIKLWTRRRFRQGVERAAAKEGLAYLVVEPANRKRADRYEGATPYAMRRGNISLRLRRGEDAAAIATDCATSIEMLARFYWSDMRSREISLDPVDKQFHDAWTALVASA